MQLFDHSVEYNMLCRLYDCTTEIVAVTVKSNE